MNTKPEGAADPWEEIEVMGVGMGIGKDGEADLEKLARETAKNIFPLGEINASREQIVPIILAALQRAVAENNMDWRRIVKMQHDELIAAAKEQLMIADGANGALMRETTAQLAAAAAHKEQLLCLHQAQIDKFTAQLAAAKELLRLADEQWVWYGTKLHEDINAFLNPNEKETTERKT